MVSLALVAASLTVGLAIQVVHRYGYPYDINELEKIKAYCFLHADREARGENVVNDLVNSGLANSTFNGWSCLDISQTLEGEYAAEKAKQYYAKDREALFADDCQHGNMAPSGWWKCWDAGKEIGLNAGECDYNRPSDPLTAAEYAECDARDKKYGEGKYADTNDDKDKDTKKSDK